MQISFMSSSPYDWTSGIFTHRIHYPCLALGKRGHGTRVLALGSYINDDLIKWPDTIIFGRTYHPSLDPLKQLRRFKSEGKRVLWDLDDDFWAVNPDNPSVLVSNAEKDQYEALVKECDAVITPSAVLANKIKKLVKNKEIFICPNMVSRDVYTERPRAHSELIIGYMGASSHWRDLMLITDVVLELQKKYEFAFQVYGLVGVPLISEMVTLEEIRRRGLEPEKVKYITSALEWWSKAQQIKVYPHIPFHIPFHTPLYHPYLLSQLDWDIGLAPLEDNEFNRSKSCVKFYEYAGVGTMTLASRVSPYMEEVNYTAKNTFKDWYNKLEKLIIDKTFREKILKEQQEYVFKNRTIQNVGLEWELAAQKPGGLKVLNQQK